MRCWLYGDDVNTDQLFPGKYTYTCATPEEILPHLLEDLDPTFSSNVQSGDILFVGKNFGCGSSREQPALGFRSVGIAAVIGKSFARIFYRAAINQGLILVECVDAVDYFKEGMKVELELEEGRVIIDGKEFKFPKLPPQILQIRDAGGLLNYTAKRLQEEKRKCSKCTCGEVTVHFNSEQHGVNVSKSHHKDIVNDILKHYEVDTNSVLIEVGSTDFPDWVVAAWVEGALCRGSRDVRTKAISTPFFLSQQRSEKLSGNTLPFIPRSRMYVPGHLPKMLLKSCNVGADMITFDLEDAVPSKEKDIAPILVRQALANLNFVEAKCLTSVRIHDLSDLHWIVPHVPLDVVIVPKCETAEYTREAVMAMKELAGSTAPLLMPIIESALGVENAFEISRAAGSQLCGVAIGLEDYTADIGAVKTTEGRESWWACSRVINAASACGSVAFDSVFANFRDSEGLMKVALSGKQLGFAGKACIHPSQVAVINKTFSPTEDEIAKARKINDAYIAAGEGAVSVDGKMVDAPVVKRARHVLALVEQSL